jgi:hypothetical protein
MAALGAGLAFELIVDLACARDCLSFARDRGFFLFGSHWSAQREAAIGADNFHVVRQHRKRLIFDHRPAYLAVISTSHFAFDCWLRGHAGAAGGESYAIVTVSSPRSADDSIKGSAILFNDDYLQCAYLLQ